MKKDKEKDKESFLICKSSSGSVMKNMKNLSMKKERLFLLANIIMLFLIMPVLFFVVVMGNEMDYWDAMKIQTIAINGVLFGISIVCFLIYFCFNKITKNIYTDSNRRNLLLNVFLIASFVGIYYINVAISKEIAFRLPWDIMIVRGGALDVAAEKNFGYQCYYSMYTNNIPIVYILGKLIKKISEWEAYKYPLEFFWIQVNCILVSVAGFYCCLTVKKLTKKIMPILFTLISYLVLVAMSAWKIAPYTDTFGMVFPIMCIYFYICYRENCLTWKKVTYLSFSLTLVMIGGFIKPSLYIFVLAIVIIESIRLVTNFKKAIGYFLITVCLLFCLLIGTDKYKEYIISDIGFDFNQEIEESWQHYFLMGLNEETTGGYNSDDVAIIGQYQESKADRSIAEIQLAFERMEERGFVGSSYFWLKKMVMTFNDGTFGWRTEVWVDSYYEGLSSDNEWMDILRSIYWDGPFVGAYNTLCQFAWIFVILCIPGICFCKGSKLENYIILTMCFLGIFFYQLLFEARARYLFVFLPLLISISACGIDNYCSLILNKKNAEN